MGLVTGGLAGKGVAEKIDPTAEDAFCREECANRADSDEGEPYESYQLAYQTGYEGFGRYPGRTYEEAEVELQRDYEFSRSSTDLSWEQTKQAARDAWKRVSDSVPRTTRTVTRTKVSST